MSGRARIEAAAAGGQPRRRWTLVSGPGVRPEFMQAYRRDDGYRVVVYFTRAGSVRSARLAAAGPGYWTGIGSRGSGKADRVLEWLAEPERFVKPAPVDPARKHAELVAGILTAVEELTREDDPK